VIRVLIFELPYSIAVYDTNASLTIFEGTRPEGCAILSGMVQSLITLSIAS